MTIQEQQGQGFTGLGIAPKLFELLTSMQFKIPTPIQQKAIPVALEGKDIVGIAQTGTGKTLAFGIPLIQRLVQTNSGVALVILPTRELALQVDEMLSRFARAFGIQTAVLIGGAPMGPQIRSIRRSARILIGTPGRIIDHLEQRILTLNNVSILVLDEADRMFDMGFAPQITRILQAVPKERQTMLFSATMPDNILAIARSHMKLPLRVEIAPSGTAAARVEHELFFVMKDQKNRLLDKLLQEYKGSVLVFSRTKHGARRICRDVWSMGHTAAELDSNRSLAQRKEALLGFKSGKYRVLVATDIASRGIDVKGIELVLNYDIPESPEDYVHRIGRTGRAEMAGRAISFVMPDQRHKVRGIERLMRTPLPVTKLPELPPSRARSPLERNEGPPFRSTSRPASPRPYRQRQPWKPRSRFSGKRNF